MFKQCVLEKIVAVKAEEYKTANLVNNVLCKWVLYKWKLHILLIKWSITWSKCLTHCQSQTFTALTISNLVSVNFYLAQVTYRGSHTLYISVWPCTLLEEVIYWLYVNFVVVIYFLCIVDCVCIMHLCFDTCVKNWVWSCVAVVYLHWILVDKMFSNVVFLSMHLLFLQSIKYFRWLWK